MKRHISIFTFLLGAVFAVGPVGGLRAGTYENVYAWFVSTGGNWNGSDRTHITPNSGTLHASRPDQPLSFTALPPDGYQVTKWLWNDNVSSGIKESDMSEITGDQYRKVSDDKKTCTLTYSGDGSRALGVRFDYMDLTVTFARNGGSGETMSPITDKTYDSSFSLTANAYAKTGYSFNGWTNDLAKSFTDKASVKGSDFWDKTTGRFHADLYACWEANTYTVTFDGNGGETPSPTSKPVTYDSTYGNLATCTREGWQFRGWYTATDGGTKIEPTTKVTIISNQTLYAQWTQKFTVTFREDSQFNDTTPKKDGVLKVESVVKGDSATPPADPVHAGYRFTGWSGNYIGVTRVENVYATYHANSYRVVFHANDGSGRTKEQPFDYGEEKALFDNPLPRMGYTLCGWATNETSTTKVYDNKQMVADLATGGTVNLYALWTPISYKVEFNSNGGEGTMDPMTPKYGELFTVPSNKFTKAGCEFKYWSAEIGGVATNFEAGAIVSNLTSKADDIIMFKAEWVGHYTVAFDGNGGEGEMTNVTYETGVEYALPSNAFTKTGYGFTGWAKSKADADALKKPAYTNGQTVVDLANPGETFTLFAEWTTNRYTVVFNPNGGTGTMANQPFVYDQPQWLRECKFTRGELWSFEGWTNSAAGGPLYADGAQVSNLCVEDGGTVTLDAVWHSKLTGLSIAMGCENLKWVDGDLQYEKGGWERCETDGCDREGRDGYPPCVMQLGADYDFGKWMHANITTNGTLSFWYRLSDETARIVVNVCSSGANPTTVGSLFGESGKWRHATFDIPFQPLQGYCIEITHLDGGDVYIDQMTWTPEGSEPKQGEPVAATAAGIENGIFSLTIPTTSGVAYGVWTNADLTVPAESWGLMETKKADGETLDFSFGNIPGFPQLFFRAYEVK